MQAIRFLGPLILALSICTPVVAGTPFIGGSVGESEIEVKVVGETFKDTDTAWKIYGGYDFMKFFGIEVGFVDFGDWQDTEGGETFAGDNRALYAVGVGQVTFAKVVTIFGEVGISSYRERLRLTQGPDTILFSNQHGPDAVYGVGIGFNIAKAQIRAEYELFETEGAEETTLATIGLRWNFD